MDFLIKFLSVLYLLHDVPAVGLYYHDIFYAGIVIVLFLLLLFKADLSFFRVILPLVFIYILDCFLKFVYFDVFYGFQSVSKVIQVLIYPMLGMYILEKKQIKYAKFILFLWLMAQLITCITTYYGCLKFPGASRYLATGWEEFYFLYTSLNIGGFAFVYKMVLLTPMLLLIIKNRALICEYKLIWVLFSIIYICLIAVMLYSAEYMTSLLLFVLSFLIFFVVGKLRVKILLIYVTLFGVLFLLSKDFIANYMLHLADTTESYVVSHRLESLALYFSEGDVGYKTDMYYRQGHYTDSLNIFLETPWGIWSFKQLGGHSFIFDNLAKFGFVGIVCLYFLFAGIYKNYVQVYLKSPYYNFILWAFLLQLVMATLNTQVYLEFFAFILPIFIYVFSSFSVKKKYKLKLD